jgi:hypothetical protein
MIFVFSFSDLQKNVVLPPYTLWQQCRYALNKAFISSRYSRIIMSAKHPSWMTLPQQWETLQTHTSKPCPLVWMAKRWCYLIWCGMSLQFHCSYENWLVNDDQSYEPFFYFSTFFDRGWICMRCYELQAEVSSGSVCVLKCTALQYLFVDVERLL